MAAVAAVGAAAEVAAAVVLLLLLLVLFPLLIVLLPLSLLLLLLLLRHLLLLLFLFRFLLQFVLRILLRHLVVLLLLFLVCFLLLLVVPLVLLLSSSSSSATHKSLPLRKARTHRRRKQAPVKYETKPLARARQPPGRRSPRQKSSEGGAHTRSETSPSSPLPKSATARPLRRPTHASAPRWAPALTQARACLTMTVTKSWGACSGCKAGSRAALRPELARHRVRRERERRRP